MFRAKSALTVDLDGKVGVAVPHPSVDDSMLLVMDVSFTLAGAIAAIDATLRRDELATVEIRSIAP